MQFGENPKQQSKLAPNESVGTQAKQMFRNFRVWLIKIKKILPKIGSLNLTKTMFKIAGNMGHF